jgi:hypothetical protein
MLLTARDDWIAEGVETPHTTESDCADHLKASLSLPSISFELERLSVTLRLARPQSTVSKRLLQTRWSRQRSLARICSPAELSLRLRPARR